MSFVTQNGDRSTQFAHRSSLFRGNTVVMRLVLDRWQGGEVHAASFFENESCVG
jgi:hypothetical protein